MKSTRFLCTVLVIFFCVPSVHARQDDPDYVKPDTSKDTGDEDKIQGVILQQDESGTFEGYGGLWRGLRRLERIQFNSNITTIRASNPLFPFS